MTNEAKTAAYVVRKAWIDGAAVFHGRFLGIPTLQNPLDTWITQEILSEVKPDVILECGTFMGGSAVLWAWLLEMINPSGRVISVDINAKLTQRVLDLQIVKKRVEFIRGSSIAPDVVRTVPITSEAGSFSSSSIRTTRENTFSRSSARTPPWLRWEATSSSKTSMRGPPEGSKPFWLRIPVSSRTLHASDS